MYISRRVVGFGLFLVLLTAFSCTDDSDDGKDYPHRSLGDGASVSNCIHMVDGKQAVLEQLQFTLEGGALAIDHYYTSRNCAWSPDVEASISGDVITVLESENILDAVAGCMCCYNVHYNAGDAEPGVYTVKFTDKYYDGEEWETDRSFTADVDLTSGFAVLDLGSHDCY